MSLFRKGKAPKVENPTEKIATRPNKKTAKSSKQTSDELEILIENGKKEKESKIAKQQTESAPNIIKETDRDEPASEAVEHTSQKVPAEAMETISQKKAVFEPQEVSLEKEFPEALVTTGRQNDNTVEPTKLSELNILKNERGTEKIVVIEGSPPESLKLNLITELETNLTIATTPLADKLLPFQTNAWDSSHGEDEPLMIAYCYELIPLYVDIGLANNIVWLATDLGYRSKGLDETYIKLCKGIADRINDIRAR